MKQEISSIMETLEQQRRILNTYVSPSRRDYEDRTGKGKEQLYSAPYHAREPTYHHHIDHNPRQDIRYAQAGLYSRNAYADYDPPDARDFLDDLASQLSPIDPEGIRGLLAQESCLGGKADLGFQRDG